MAVVQSVSTWKLPYHFLTFNHPGGVAPGDTSFILQRLAEQSTGAAVLGALEDPGAKQICLEVDVGARLTLRVGGNTGEAADQPFDLTVRVRAAVRENSQDMLSIRGASGPAVWVETDFALHVLLMSMRSQVFSPHAFTGLGLGLGPGDKRLIMVQGMQHLYAAFAPLASEVLYVSALGALGFNFAHLPCRVRDTNYWPSRLEPHGLG